MKYPHSPLFSYDYPYVLNLGRYLIELDDGKIGTGKPNQFDGKNPWVSGEDFPNKTNPLSIYRIINLLTCICQHWLYIIILVHNGFN